MANIKLAIGKWAVKMGIKLLKESMNNMNKKIRIIVLMAIILAIFIPGTDMDVIPYKIVTCIILVYCIEKGFTENIAINPYLLFAITPLSLLCYNVHLAPNFLDKLSPSTWVLCIYNIVGFLIGLALPNVSQQAPNKTELSSSDKQKMVIHVVILGLLGITPVICRYLHLALPFRSFMSMFVYIGFALAMKTKQRRTILLALLFVVVSFFETFNKTLFIRAVFCFIVYYEAYFIKSRKQKYRVYFSLIITVVFLLLIAFPLKTYMSEENSSYLEFMQNTTEIISYDETASRVSFEGPKFLAKPYMYFVTSWTNVQYIQQTQDFRTYGLWTFKPLLTYIGLNEQFANAYILIPEKEPYNTFSFIGVLFKDFGYWGSVIGAIFLGIYVKFIRRRFCANGSAFDVATYSLVSIATLEMFFSNHFFMVSYPFTILIVGYIYKKIFRLDRY